MVPGLGARPGRRPLHLGRPGPTAGCRRVRPLPRQPPGRLPAELLRLPARAELRLRPPGPGRALASAGRRRRAPGPTARRCARSWTHWLRPRRVRVPRRHGRLAGQGRSGPRRDRQAVARDCATGWTRRTRTRRCCPSGATRRCPCPRASTPTSSCSSAARPTARPLRSLWSNGTGTTDPIGPRRPVLLRRRGPGLDGDLPRRVATDAPPPSARPGTSPCRPPTTTSPACAAARAPPSNCRPPSRSSSPGRPCRRSTTVTRSACATSLACRTTRAASLSPELQPRRVPHPDAVGRQPPTPASPLPRPAASTCRSTRTPTARPSPPSGPTRPRSSTWSAT